MNPSYSTKVRCVYRIATLLFVIFIAAASASAQTTRTPTPQPSPTLESQFFKNILRDQRAIWTSPFHLHRAATFYLVMRRGREQARPLEAHGLSSRRAIIERRLRAGTRSEFLIPWR